MYSVHEIELFINGIIEPPTHYGDELDDSSLGNYWRQYKQGLQALEAQRLEAEGALYGS